MLKNRYIKWTLKLLSALLSFILVWCGIQPFFVPKYIGDSTTIVKGYSYLEKNSIDVLFLGASQMFCGIDSGKLTDEYNIKSYDYGASSQPMTVTSYYLSEALKTQSPKLIMVEVCEIFSSKRDVTDKKLAWNYNPMSPSLLKFQSVSSVLDDRIKAVEYSFSPLLLYHDRWSTINDKRNGGEHDIDFVLYPEKYIDFSARGFLARNHIEKKEIAFFKRYNYANTIPKENEDAIMMMNQTCKKNNIELVFIKVPVSNWTKGDSLSVKQLMDENGLKFIDLNDYLKEIGINGDTDFYNENHLNMKGARKTTDYLAKIIPQYLH